MSDEDNRRRMVLPGPLDADGNGDARWRGVRQEGVRDIGEGCGMVA